MKNTTTHYVLGTIASLCVLQASHAASNQEQESTQERTQSGRVAPPIERFKAVAAARLGTTIDRVELGGIEGPMRLADLGIDLFVAGAVAGDGEKTVIALRPDGVAVDFDAARALDRSLALRTRGKIAPRLYEELRASPLGERHLVVAWIDAPPVEDLRADHAYLTSELDRAGLLVREEAELHETDLTRRIAERIRPSVEDAVARFTGRGIEVVGSDELAPIVFVRADAQALASLHDDPSVLSLDSAGMEYVERLNVAVGEVRANAVWPAPGGVTGVGAKVSIVENGAVCPNNPFLPLAARRVAGPTSTHTTGVASCVASNHPLYKGVAPGATLISANAADFTGNSVNVTAQMPGSVAAVSWSIAQGAQIMNLSYGAATPNANVSSFDKYLDYVVRYNARTIAIACGNSGGFAGDPGAGYNQLAVGAFDDLGTSPWTGESMAWFSSWMNPNTGVETPQLAAPGVNITMLNCTAPAWSGYTDSGTSFSSPIVAGAAALCVSRSPVLGTWPEAVRAILMSTAWHNIEGAPHLSSRDGAGGADAYAAFRVTSRGRGPGYEFGVLGPASFDATGFFTAQTCSAVAGQTVRACLSFDSTVSGGPNYGSDSLMADLDLYVFAPNGALVARSISGIQPFEMVQFFAPLTGNYTVKVRRFSFNGTSEYFGTAFSTNADI